ncbi:MAG: hypothetical protein HKN56_07585, partial [Gammaproteobacteria bacterium]|nr:hypothetical protein [Gammaproteobacteria bacterium]
MKSMQNVIILVAALLLAACGQPESGQSGQADTAETGTGLDMSLGANKVTADDYRHEPVPVAEKSVTSVDASGNIAPFGMASRAPREIAPVQVA